MDGTSVMDDLTSLLRQLAWDRKEGQDQRESEQERRRQDDERLRTQILEVDRRTAAASEVAFCVTGERIGTATSAGEVRGDGSSVSLLALGEAEGLTRSGASSSVDSHRAEVGSREFGSLKQSVPKVSGKLDFPLRKEHFEMFTSMAGCMSAFLVDRDMVIGDVTKNTQYFLSQGFSEEHVETARVAWTCGTGSIVNRDMLGRVFATKSPSAGWRMLCDCFMPNTCLLYTSPSPRD